MVEQSEAIIKELHGIQDAVGRKESKGKAFLTYISLILSIVAFFCRYFHK